MLKTAGIVLILFSACGLGFGQSLELSRREKNLEAVLRMTLFLKGEIRFGNSSLGDAFWGISGKVGGELGDFLKNLSLRMRESSGRSLGEIFRDCAEKCLTGTRLSKSEKESFYALGESLGYLDREMQLRQLELFERDLEMRLRDLRMEMPSKKKVYQSMGILGGVLLAVLLW